MDVGCIFESGCGVALGDIGRRQDTRSRVKVCDRLRELL